MQIKPEDLIGKKVVIGFGSNENRLVVEFADGTGVTFFDAAEMVEKLETTGKEAITLKITPGTVVCMEFGFVFPWQVFFKLGRHRFLTAIAQGEGVLRVVYLPDEEDIETHSSEFLNQVRL